VDDGCDCWATGILGGSSSVVCVLVVCISDIIASLCPALSGLLLSQHTGPSPVYIST